MKITNLQSNLVGKIKFEALSRLNVWSESHQVPTLGSLCLAIQAAVHPAECSHLGCCNSIHDQLCHILVTQSVTHLVMHNVLQLWTLHLLCMHLAAAVPTSSRFPGLASHVESAIDCVICKLKLPAGLQPENA